MMRSQPPNYATWPSKRRIVRSEGAAIRSSWVTEEPHDLLPAAGVEVARRLVGKKDGRVVGQRPGQGDPLLLTAGKLRRPMLFPAQEPNGLEHLGHPLPPPFRVFSVEEERDLGILPSRGVRKEVEVLEFKPEHAVSAGYIPGLVAVPEKFG